MPLHRHISEQLRQRITAGDYPPGAKLPSERELIAAFGVSRITVRRAIANLVDQGLAIAHQGKGVFVTERRKAIYTITNPGLFLTEDLANQGIHVTLETITFERVTPPERVQQILQLPTEQAYLQKKLLYMDRVPGCVDVTYVLPEIGEVLAAELQHNMTFPTLEQHQIPIERVEAMIECQNADPELSDYLQVPLGHSLLVYRHTAYTTGDRPVLHGDSISRGDRFCYAVSLEHHC
ncbi:MAG: GntR family transcriptional regulator [Spirulinaceae cyanobacterium]